MARRWSQYLQLHGYKGTHEAQLDPIRSEYPLGVGSGFAAVTSAGVNLILSVPSGKQVLIKYIYLNAATVGNVLLYDGGSVASLNTTVFNAYIPSAQSAPGVLQLSPYGLYIQSILFASAFVSVAIKVGGLIMDISAAP